MYKNLKQINTKTSRMIANWVILRQKRLGIRKSFDKNKDQTRRAEESMMMWILEESLLMGRGCDGLLAGRRPRNLSKRKLTKNSKSAIK